MKFPTLEKEKVKSQEISGTGKLSLIVKEFYELLCDISIIREDMNNKIEKIDFTINCEEGKNFIEIRT